MIFCTVKLSGEIEDVLNMTEILAEYDETFADSEELEYDFLEEGIVGIDSLRDFEQIAVDLSKSAPNAEFYVKGYVENKDNVMKFEISKTDSKLVSMWSEWYVNYYICRFNYASYEAFCENTGLSDAVTEEQFLEFLNEETDIAVYSSGKVFKEADIPLDLKKDLKL